MELQRIPKLSDSSFEGGYVSSAPKEHGSNYMAAGSENMTLTGTGKTLNFKDVAIRADEDGGKVMFNVAETYASLGQTSDDDAYGSVFNVFAAIFYIGLGLLRLAGVSLLVNASSTLSLLIKRNGVYTDPASGPWQAGLAQPSAPVITAIAPPAGFEGKNNGVVSVVIWRIRSTTGAVSIKSNVSNIVAASNQSIAVQLSLKDANGQDYWGIGVTKNIEGRVGSHFELTEIAESAVAQSSAVTVTGLINTGTEVSAVPLTIAGLTLTSTHIGWVLAIPSIAYTGYITNVLSSTTAYVSVDIAAAATAAAATLTNGVGGTARTIVIEWRDGDLIGKRFAPTRDFPPPAALYGSTLEDIAYVDGAYADAVQSVSNTVRGAAICPSERGKPESYSPDTAIFTSDTPTALIKGDGVDWRFCRNSMYVIRYLGGEKPLSAELAWSGVGVQYQTQVCLGEGGRPYVWAESAFRLGAGGLPESDFANVVADDLAACTDASKKVTGWDGNYKVVCYCYERRIWAFYTAAGVWWSPCTATLDSDIKSCVTENNLLLISTANDSLYEFNVGTGSIAKVRTGWTSARGSLDTIHSVIASVRADNLNPITIEVFADGLDEVVSTDAITPTRTGYQRLLPVLPNVLDTESHSIRITIASSGGDVGLERVEAFGDSNSILQ